ncbi:Cutinase transcription factor 1 alpha [Talaromyces islandicus]|uniref:Cutinase transcription factor 1 alpha n=1 Tax=Talaromyces islandicus TaxID=28573 RepID=A0A0U1LZR2_TALIS|nr:Cutinase transcription factor 1 alpha [Talaromyces islandicus]
MRQGAAHLLAVLGQVCYYRTTVKASSASFPLRSLGLPDWYLMTQAGITDAVRTRGLATIGDEGEVLKMASEYFETLHTWFPIIPPARYYQQMAVVWSQPNPDVALLALATFLLTCTPEHEKLTSQTLSLYTFVKSIIGTLESTGVNTLELIHARLLLTIFEAGHGISHAAYISIGATIRAAAALGFDNIHTNSAMLQCLDPPITVGDAKQTWRGIMCLDKYLSLELHKCSGEFKTALSPDDILTEDPIISDCASHNHGAEFTILFQATHILDQALAHVYNPLSQEEFNTSEAIQILSTLNSLKSVLAGKNLQGSRLYDGTVSLCYSASIALFVFWANLPQPNNDSCVLSAEALMVRAVEDILDHFQHLEYNNSPTVLDSLPIFVSQSIFKAAVVLTRELKHTSSLDVQKSLMSCEAVLRRIAKRWLVGKQYLAYLENV